MATVEGTAEHPVPFKDGYPTVDNRYNTATQVQRDVQVRQRRRDADHPPRTDNGILFEGDEGPDLRQPRRAEGKPVEELPDNPLPEDAIGRSSTRGKQPGSHMGNFFECVKEPRRSRSPTSITHHRAMTTCHLANIAIRLGRKLEWDPKTEQIVSDKEANQWLAREQRKGYEINV